jgi:NADPH:quinone reductase-like Zn-dependent oxidoreductase
MQALWLVKRGTWEVREAPEPLPKPGEVRIAVRAFGLNFAELMASQGLYPTPPNFPQFLDMKSPARSTPWAKASTLRAPENAPLR